MLSRYRRTITTIGTPRNHKRIGMSYLLPSGEFNRGRIETFQGSVNQREPRQKRNPAACAARFPLRQNGGKSALKLDPDALRTPIAAALVLAPPVLIVGSPLPIIGVDLNASIRGVGISLFGAPAVARAIANDGGRRRCCTKSQKANGHQDRTSEMFHCCLLSFQVVRKKTHR